MTLRAPSATVAALVFASACRFPTHPGYSCQGVYIHAVKATVNDAVTGANILSGSSLIVREGAYVDSVTADVAGYLAAARDRPGTYAVTVRRSGYQPFTQNGVVVGMDKDECHVIPVTVAATLQPAP